MSSLDSHATVPPDRYGRAQRVRIDRRLGWIIGVVFVAATIAFFLFSGWQEGSRVAVQDTDFNRISDSSAEVVFEVSSDPSNRVACAVEALNASKGTVGWKIVEVPQNGERNHTVRTTVRTVGVARAGQAKECWVVDPGD